MTIQFKRLISSGSTPSVNDLKEGELAINLADKQLFTKNDKGSIIAIGGGGGSGGVTTVNGMIGDVLLEAKDVNALPVDTTSTSGFSKVNNNTWVSCAQDRGFLPYTNNSCSLGTASFRWGNAYIGAINANSVEVSGGVKISGEEVYHPGNKPLLQDLEGYSRKIFVNSNTTSEANFPLYWGSGGGENVSVQQSPNKLTWNPAKSELKIDGNEVYSPLNKPTPSDLNALGNSGDQTLEGDLVLKGNQKHLKFQHTSHNGGDILWEWNNSGTLSQQGRIWSLNPDYLAFAAGDSSSIDGAGVFVIGRDNSLKVGGKPVYSEHNRPYSYGTEEPTGGAEGDVYFQYEEVF